MGKPVGGDLRQGVVTLPALIYLEDHPGDPDLAAVVRRERLALAVIDGLVDRVRCSTAIDRSLEIARGFIREALDDLMCLPDGPERLALEEIAWGIVERDT
jgi:geranylgeranyl pyrophosphate synthase